MKFMIEKVLFVEFLLKEKERIEEMRQRGGFYDFKYGQYILDEIDVILLKYMEVYEK